MKWFYLVPGLIFWNVWGENPSYFLQLLSERFCDIFILLCSGFVHVFVFYNKCLQKTEVYFYDILIEV